MKKSNFVALILGIIGGIFFSLGMCMALMPEWGALQQGILSGVIGLLVLFADLLIWRKMEGKEPIKINGKTIATIIIGIIGALLFGVGMCLCMVFNKMILGIIIGIVGIIVLLMLIPLTKGLK